MWKIAAECVRARRFAFEIHFRDLLPSLCFYQQHCSESLEEIGTMCSEVNRLQLMDVNALKRKGKRNQKHLCVRVNEKAREVWVIKR